MAWLMTSFSQAVRNSSGCCLSSSQVFTWVWVVIRVSWSDDRFGVEGFEIGGELGEFRRQVALDGSRQRLGRPFAALVHDTGERARLLEQEHLAAAHAEYLAADFLCRRRAQISDEIGDVLRGDFHRPALVLHL